MKAFRQGIINHANAYSERQKTKKMKARFFRVKNRDRKFGSVQDYFALIIDGKRYLLTEDQLSVSEVRAKQNPEDFKRPGFFSKIFGK